MKFSKKNILTLGLLAVCASHAFAGPFTGVTAAATDLATIGKAAAAIVGGALTLFCGTKAAFKAYRDEDWVGYGITAIVSVAIAFIAGAAM